MQSLLAVFTSRVDDCIAQCVDHQDDHDQWLAVHNDQPHSEMSKSGLGGSVAAVLTVANWLVQGRLLWMTTLCATDVLVSPIWRN
jgi:hypothetical protein